MPTVITVLGTVGAYFLGGWNERRSAIQKAHLDRVAREEERQTAAARSRNEFQLDTLLELQEAARRLARSAATSIIEDQKTLDNDGASFVRPEGFDQGGEENRLRYIQLMSRVIDDELRFELERFNITAGGMMIPPLNAKKMSKEQLQAEMAHRFSALAPVANAMIDRIGVAVRKLLQQDVSVPRSSSIVR